MRSFILLVCLFFFTWLHAAETVQSRQVQVGNMVVDEQYRSAGVGKTMLDFIEGEGKKQGCQHFILDSRLNNTKSHDFYLREGFEIMGYHFMKDI